MGFEAKAMSPHPWDVLLAKRGFMTARATDAKGNPTGPVVWKGQRMKFSPGTPTPEAQPFVQDLGYDLPQAFVNYDSGIGYRKQSEKADRDVDGLWYMLNGEKAGDFLVPGPQAHACTVTTPDTTNGGNQAIEFTVNGTVYWVVAQGRYLQYTTDGTTFSVAKDFGSGAKITGLAVFRGTQSGDYLFIALGSQQKYWVWDGTSATTTFTQHASLKAYDFVTYHNELWMLNTGTSSTPDTGGGGWEIQKCVDGGTAPTWGGAFIVADQDALQTCKHLAIHNDKLYIRGNVGLLAVSSGATNSQNVTGSAFQFQQVALNECRPVSFSQYLLTEIGSSWFALDANAVGGAGLAEVGPGTLKNLENSPIFGNVTAACGYSWWTVFYAVYNPATSTAYLMRWGEWKHFQTVFHPIDERVFLPAHIGASYSQTAQINGMAITSLFGSNPRLYIFDAAGGITYFILPRSSMNWLGDPNCRFTTSATSIYFPAVTGHAPTIDKALLAAEVGAKNLTSSNFLTLTYRLNATDSYGNAGNLDNAGVFTMSPGSRALLIASVKSKWIDTLLTITNTSATTPPAVNALLVYTIPQPKFKQVYTTTLRVAENVGDRQGAIRRDMTVSDQLNFLRNLGNAGVFTVLAPDGDAIDVMLSDYQEQTVYQEPDGSAIQWDVTLELTEHRRRPQYTWEHPESVIWNFLDNYRWQDIEGDSGNVIGAWRNTEAYPWATAEQYTWTTIPTL